jgi:hypothetical protein
VRNDQWRYIRYFDGSEELYDHRIDPNEWTNLADDNKFRKIKIEMAKWVPTHEEKLRPNGVSMPVCADKPELDDFKKLWESLGN